MCKPKILIVEDESSDVKNIKLSLNSYGYNVVGTAYNREEALIKVAKFKPDLILMDVNLKLEIDDLEDTIEIKEDFDHIPVVYLNAHTEENVKQPNFTAPYGYIIKPFNKIELKNIIDLALTKHEMEEQLKKANDNLIRVQRIAEIGNWEHNLITNEIYWSDEMYKILNFPTNSPIHHVDLTIIFSNKELKRFQHAINASIKDHVPYSMDYKIMKLNGSIGYIHDEGEIVRNDKGEAISMFGTTQDITKRKLVEIALSESEEKYRGLFDNAQDMISLNEMKGNGLPGKFLEVNKIGIERLGYTRNEFLNMTPKDIVDPEKHAEMIKIADELNKNGFTKYEIVHVTKDGRKIPVEINNHIFELNGENVALAVSRDITEIKLVENALINITDRNRALVNYSMIAVYETNLQGDILFANDAMAKMFDFKSVEDLKANKIIQLYKNSEVRDKFIDELKKEKSLSKYELELVSHTGRTINVIISAHLSDDIIFGMIMDITELKDIERKLKLANNYNRSLIEASVDPFIIIGIDGKITDVNNSTELLTGYSRDEIIFTNFSDYFTDLQKAQAGYQQVFQNGFVRDYELEIRHKNGQITPVLYNGSVYLNKEGEVVGVFAAVRDVIENKKSEKEKQNLLENTQQFAEELEASYEELQITSRKLQSTNQELLTTTKELQSTNNELKLIGAYNRSLIEASVDPLVIIGPDGKITDVNNSTEEVTGYNRIELIGTDFSDYFTEPEKARDGYQQVFNEGLVRNYPLEIQHKNGHITPVLYNASVYRDQESEVIGVFAAARDITELKNAEINLKMSEERFRTVAESAVDGIITSNLDGIIIYCNNSLANIFGYSINELIGKNLTVLMPDKFKKDYLNQLKMFKLSGIHKQVGKVVSSYGLRKDGVEFPLEMSLSSWTSEEKVYLTSIIRDLTERKKMEDALKESESKFRNLVETSPDMIWEIDLKGVFTYISPNCLEVIGYKREDMIGNSIRLFVTPESVPKIEKIFYSHLKNKNFSNVFEVPIKKYNENRILEIHSAVIKDNDGQSIGFRGVASDITERKNVEEKIRNSLAEKEILLKEVHHRVKNNLQIILSLLDLQESYVKDDRKAVNVLQESQNRVLSMAMLHEMLYQSNDLTNINFLDYITNLVSNLFDTYDIESNKIITRINVDNVCLNIETAVPCGLIISELISNSLKYAFPNNNTGNLDISLKTIENYFLLIIKDDGIGFPENLDFTNIKSSLGLKLVNTLVKQLDGTIILDTSHGTKFTIKFKEQKYKKRI